MFQSFQRGSLIGSSTWRTITEPTRHLHSVYQLLLNFDTLKTFPITTQCGCNYRTTRGLPRVVYEEHLPKKLLIHRLFVKVTCRLHNRTIFYLMDLITVNYVARGETQFCPKSGRRSDMPPTPATRLTVRAFLARFVLFVLSSSALRVRRCGALFLLFLFATVVAATGELIVSIERTAAATNYRV